MLRDRLSKFTERKVKEHFTEASEEYATRKGYVHPEHDPVILNFIKDTCTEDSKVLEVGGGSGYMLDLISSETDIKHLYNCEIVPEVYRNQINKEIGLIGGDALNLPFKSSSFDYVIIKNLLHHLVGRTRRESKDNARRAVKELKRVTKDGGYIIILEQYNRHEFFSTVIFYLTLFFSVFGISFKSFGLRKYVIVSFLTPDEIRKLLTGAGDVEIVLDREKRLDVSKKWKYTLLMSDIGRLLIIGKVRTK